jgi:uncharacterized protein
MSEITANGSGVGIMGVLPAEERNVSLIPKRIVEGSYLKDGQQSGVVIGAELARKLDIGLPTVDDILHALARPGRDPREDLPQPVFRRDILRIEDLQAGMELKGTILNVVDFGAFVDIGLKDSGLVHISQLANRFVRNPHEIVTVGDVVSVWVMAVDNERRRVSLTMIAPGTERQPEEHSPREARGERRQGGERQQQGDRPPRQDRGPDTGPRGDRPPRRGQQRRGPRPEKQPAQEGHATPPPPQRRFPERKPPKPKPLPKLTAEKREGKAYLNTLGELEAFFKARETPAEPPPSDTPSTEAPG